MVAPGVLGDEDAVEGVWEGAVCWLCAAARAGYITSEAATAIAMHWAINDFVIEYLREELARIIHLTGGQPA